VKPSEGVKRLDEAIGHGHDAIETAVSLFPGGTVPPPPWPSPELYKAIDDAKDVRERLDVFVRHGDPDFNAKTPQVRHVVSEVERRIATVELEAKRLRERADVVKTQTPQQALVKIKAALPSKKWLLLGGLAYLLLNEKRPRGR